MSPTIYASDCSTRWKGNGMTRQFLSRIRKIEMFFFGGGLLKCILRKNEHDGIGYIVRLDRLCMFFSFTDSKPHINHSLWFCSIHLVDVMV